VRIGQAEEVWPKLQHSRDPRLRSFIVNWLAPLGVNPHEIAAELERIVPVLKPTPAERQQAMDAILFSPETSKRRALILALGQYDTDRLPPDERKSLIAKLLDLYRNDPDAGVHGASEWTLRRWKLGELLRTTDAELQGLKDRGDRRWYVNSQGQSFAVVNGPVEFLMGSPDNEPDRDSDETLHRRRINQRFALATKAITREQYQQFVRTNPKHGFTGIERWSPDPEGPHIGASWYDAAAYCNWLSEQEGLDRSQWCYDPNDEGEYAEGMKIVADFLERAGYRLPTEAEWEYACRAGAVTSRYYGQSVELLGQYAWYSENSKDQAWPCGRVKPNDLGLFDPLGNVYEWCQDQYEQYPQGTVEDRKNHIRTFENILEKYPRLVRGEMFTIPPGFVRSALRHWSHPSNRSIYAGFRPSRTYP
jgi:formylglycine-generating enzyme required for sulfatase activity